MIPNSYMPRQDIPEIDKGPDWFKKHANYAESILIANRQTILKMDRLYNSYNGKTESDSIKHLVSTYGTRNRSKYISYRLSKTKIDILIGEFLQMNLNSTVKTINQEAVTDKVQKYEFALGVMHSRSALKKLKEVGVDVMEGADIPEANDPSAFAKLIPKQQEEVIMQIMLKNFIREYNLLDKFASNVQDCLITSRHWGRIEVNELTGDLNYRVIDPRDRIVLEYDRDPYLEKSPIAGSLRKMPIHEILTTYKLTQAERDKLDAIRQNPGNYTTSSTYRGRYYYVEGQLCADVIHLEWKSVRPRYRRKSPKTKNQLFMDDTSDNYITTLSDAQAKEYELKMKKGYVDENITVEWEEDMYEVLRIGHDVIPVEYQRRKPFIMRDEDTGKILTYSYFGGVFNKVDGDSISLKEVCDNFDTAFDTIMYQLLREVNKAKGKVIMYDRAGLPKGQTVKGVLYNALNDSFIDYNSAAAGNMSGKDLSMSAAIKEIDLGVSNSIVSLLQMKNEIVQMLDMITGIHGAREGKIAASATVANSQQSDAASRTITEPIFYHLTKSFERIMLGIVETGKLVWGLYQPNKARMVLGDEKYGYLKASPKIAYCSYAVSLVNPRYEQAIKERMQNYAELALNAKEIRVVDILDFEMQETLAEARQVLRDSWNKIQDSRDKAAQQNNEAQAQINEKQMQTQMQIATENREDQQAAKLEQIDRQGEWMLKLNSQKDRNKLMTDLTNNENSQFDEMM